MAATNNSTAQAIHQKPSVEVVLPVAVRGRFKTDPTDLQNLVEDMRINQLHVSNLLSLVEDRAKDEMEITIVVAARRYLDDAYCIWEKIEAISNVEAEKEGA